MWKKDEPERPNRTDAAPPPQTQAPSRPAAPARSAAPGPERAVIGPSISITGEVSGDEDLLIEGRIDGTVNLEQHSVTVGREGRVKAGISGRTVVVEGSVEGDLRALEQVILRSSARVTGDVTAPRVVLEDGATFRGRVDMGDPGGRGARQTAAAGPKPATTSSSEPKAAATNNASGAPAAKAAEG
jgi:cytoskeletal protein CcmA (bactofilin family)